MVIHAAMRWPMEPDDNSWWHQQDLELQQQDEAERIARCELALAELDAIIKDELQKITRELQ
jgi:hypothetical protein